MACTNCYTDADTLKTRLDIVGSDDDTMLETMIEAASRMIDGWCGRSFFEATAQTRYYTPERMDSLFLDDYLVSVTTLKTDEDADRVYETTWATTDYDLEPDTGPPYSRIYARIDGDYLFPTHRRAVQIVGSFGYSAVPHAVREACLLQTARLFKRADAPFGVAGTQDAGQLQTISSVDPDVKQLLAPFKRLSLVGV